MNDPYYDDNLFGYTQSQADADAAIDNAQPGDPNFAEHFRRGFDSSGHHLAYGYTSVSANPDPFRRGINADTAFQTRKRARRIYAPAAAALAAQNQLFDPTLALVRRGATGYGDLFRYESDVARAHQIYQNAESDPMGFNLLNMLTGDAGRLVGRSADPYADHELQQSLRAAQASRGMGYGNGDVLNEVLGLDRARDLRREQRGAYATGVLGARQNYLSAPAAMPEAANIMSPVQPSGTDDLFSTSINDTTERRNSKAARLASNSALIGAGIQAIGSIAGGVACWVAEVLYGTSDIRTHLARAWVLEHDTPFTRLYRVQGKRWARWLAANPWAKPLVQPVWDHMWQAQLKAVKEGVAHAS